MEAEELHQAINEGGDTAVAQTGLRERWRSAMAFAPSGALPNFEFGYWAETLGRWRAQGLPAWVVDEASAYRYFGIENWAWAPVDVMGPRPTYEREILAEDDETITYRDPMSGAIAQINKHGSKSIPHYLEFAVTDRRSWEGMKERLQPGPERLADDWPQRCAALAAEQRPVAISIGSMIGQPRNWMGFEGICYALADDPELVEDMVETSCQLVCETLTLALPDLNVDFGFGWEDICFNSGPIVGVDFMQRVVAPRWRRVTDLLHQHGIEVCMTDCDGDINAIIPAMREGGLDCLFPVEVHAGSDPVAIRQAYPEMRLQGGVDKMILTAGKDAIRSELERLAPVVREGGFLPGVDHRVQADVDLEAYEYYLALKRDLFGVGGVPDHEPPAGC